MIKKRAENMDVDRLSSLCFEKDNLPIRDSFPNEQFFALTTTP